MIYDDLKTGKATTAVGESESSAFLQSAELQRKLLLPPVSNLLAMQSVVVSFIIKQTAVEYIQAPVLRQTATYKSLKVNQQASVMGVENGVHSLQHSKGCR